MIAPNKFQFRNDFTFETLWRRDLIHFILLYGYSVFCFCTLVIYNYSYCCLLSLQTKKIGLITSFNGTGHFNFVFFSNLSLKQNDVACFVIKFHLTKKNVPLKITSKTRHSEYKFLFQLSRKKQQHSNDSNDCEDKKTRFNSTYYISIDISSEFLQCCLYTLLGERVKNEENLKWYSNVMFNKNWYLWTVCEWEKKSIHVGVFKLKNPGWQVHVAFGCRWYCVRFWLCEKIPFSFGHVKWWSAKTRSFSYSTVIGFEIYFRARDRGVEKLFVSRKSKLLSL